MMSTFQKVALISCLVLCVSLILPKLFLTKGKKESGQSEGISGWFPPFVQRQKTNLESKSKWSSGSHFPTSHHADATARVRTGGGGGGSGRSSFMGQVIPIYGFGIFLYILYILFKLSTKGKTCKPDKLNARNDNTKKKISDYELSQLEAKLKDTEEALEKIVCREASGPGKVTSVTSDQEEKLLSQLKEITRVMKEGNLIDDVSPEIEAEEASYLEDWEGYPEETFPLYCDLNCHRHRCGTVFVDHPYFSHLSAEQIAEELEEELEEAEDAMENQGYFCGRTLEQDVARHKEVHPVPVGPTDGLETQLNKKGNESLLRDKDQKFCSYDNSEEEEENPAVIAENIGFTCESSEDEEKLTEENSTDINDTEDKMKCDIAHKSLDKLLRKRNAIGLE
ncbi:protein RIC-3 [Protopterus annectens]|uniref:protein RIC-3 n=1 Tax=Protopterus annectens TaxID=7888 RepID=UPI001CFAB90A|nr:protein RIC-3 [Protopterus annectens]